MSDAITNFILSKAELMSWVKTRLLTNTTDWNSVRYFEGQNINKLLTFLPTTKPPSCIYMYLGSKYQKKPRALPRFAVIVTARNFVDKEAIQPVVLGMIDKVIGLLDHEKPVDSAVCLAVSDEWVQISGSENDNLSSYRIEFMLEDY